MRIDPLAVWLVFGLLPSQLTAQPPAGVTWVQGGGGALEDFGWAVALDHSGGIVLAGHVTAPATFGTTTIASGAGQDIILAKYDLSGRLEWLTPAGGPGLDEARSVAVDAARNIYLAGGFSGRALFGTNEITGAGVSDVYLSQYDPQGAARWVWHAGGSGNDEARAVVIDQSRQRVFLAGIFQGEVKAGNRTLVSRGSTDLFWARFEPDGTWVWTRSAGGAGADQAEALAVSPDGDLLLVGSFQQTAVFDAATVVSFGGGDAFVAKFDATGALRWVTGAGGADPRSNDGAHGVVADHRGLIYVTGGIMSDSRFGEFSVRHAGGGDGFVAAYDALGSVRWAYGFGGSGPDQGRAIAVDANGDIYVTGFFFHRVEFGSTLLESEGHADVFVAKFEPDGRVVWAIQAGGSAYKGGYGLAVSPSGSCFITGFYRGTTDFGRFRLVNDFASNRDLFLARIDGPAFAPKLEILPMPGAVVLSWPAAAEEYQLQSSDSAAVVTRWTDERELSVEASGHRWSAIRSTSDPQRYFRLRSPASR